MKLSKLRNVSALLALAAIASADLSFSGPTPFATGPQPSDIASADFDGDGDVDFAVNVDTPDRISVYFNNGSGVFGAPVNYPTGAGTGLDGIVAADLDGDSDIDIAVTLSNSNQVRTYLNQGGGAFVAGVVTAVGQEPGPIVAGHFGGTAAIDLATSNREGNTVSILTAGLAGYAVTAVATQLEPRGLAVGDMDADGDDDLVVSNHDSRTISFLRNTNGAFANAQSYAVHAATRPDGIAVVDLDGDSDLDIGVAISDDVFNFVAVFQNNGGGVFGAPVNFATGGIGTSGIDFGDFDGDGDSDVGVSNSDSNNASFMENNGLGAFGAATVMPAGTRPGWVELMDMNGDGGLDVAISNRDSSNLSFYLNNNAGGFTSPTNVTFLSGIVVGGNLASLQSSDDDRLVMRPGIVISSAIAPIRIEVEGVANAGTASRVRFIVESSGSATTLSRTIEMFNFATGQWVVMDTRAATTTDTTTEIDVTVGASNFVDPVTRAVRSRIHWRAVGPVFVYPWDARTDMVRWVITP
jgi:hypothetical protein